MPAIALLLGMVLALFLLIGVRRRAEWPVLINEGLASAAPIVLITGMGGALGSVLRATGVVDVLSASIPAAKLGRTPSPYDPCARTPTTHPPLRPPRSRAVSFAMVLAAAIKIVQGSGTVAITVTASIMAPLMDSAGLGSAHSRALTVVAIGAGSLVVCHVNDSMFWVFTRLLRCDMGLALRTYTPGSLLIGLSAAAATGLMHLHAAVAPVAGVALAGSFAYMAAARKLNGCPRRRARRGEGVRTRTPGPGADARMQADTIVLTDSMAGSMAAPRSG